MKRAAAFPCTLLCLSTLLVLAGSAQAEDDRHKGATSPIRDGLFMGATFGRGSIEVDCESCNEGKITEALSVSAHAGYMVTPRIGILGEHWAVRYNDSGSDLFDDSARHLVAQHMSTVAAQLFVTNRLWVKAGFGVGWHITDGDYDQAPSRTGPVPVGAKGGQTAPEASDESTAGSATFAAIGWEMAHNEVFAMDIQFRVGTTKRPDERYQILNTGLNIGFNWY